MSTDYESHLSLIDNVITKCQSPIGRSWTAQIHQLDFFRVQSINLFYSKSKLEIYI